ncbi:MAG: exodeoxyribonuclease VII small subunit [Clostridia bacterium]|nr:exodeoxyribonuclease VII small subunit [Clostridia bacterium]
MAAKKKLSFEDKLRQVDGMVTAMEAGGLSLEDTLKQYEEGMALLREMEQELAEATQRLTVLRRQADGSEAEEALEVDA